MTKYGDAVCLVQEMLQVKFPSPSRMRNIESTAAARNLGEADDKEILEHTYDHLVSSVLFNFLILHVCFWQHDWIAMEEEKIEPKGGGSSYNRNADAYSGGASKAPLEASKAPLEAREYE